MKGKILVIDDEPVVRQVIGIHLEDAGYEVASASSLEEAIDLMKTVQPLLAVCDLFLPDAGGSSPAHLRARWPALPVVVISGLSDVARSEALSGPGLCFVEKPFTKKALLEAVESLLSTGGVLPGNV